VDNRGRTPLHIAAGVGCCDCADLLIQAGAIFSIIFIYSKSAGCSYLYYKIFFDSLRLIRDEVGHPVVRHV
jgi:ankyrin repeat protein